MSSLDKINRFRDCVQDEKNKFFMILHELDELKREDPLRTYYRDIGFLLGELYDEVSPDYDAKDNDTVHLSLRKTFNALSKSLNEEPKG